MNLNDLGWDFRDSRLTGSRPGKADVRFAAARSGNGGFDGDFRDGRLTASLGKLSFSGPAPQLYDPKVEEFVHADLHCELKAEAGVDLKQSDAQQRRDPHRDGYQKLGKRL